MNERDPPRPLANAFYNPTVNMGTDGVARNLIHQLQEEQHHHNGPAGNHHAHTIDVNNNQYPGGSGKQFENQKEFDLDLYRSELATINEVPNMMDNVTTEQTHSSPINSDNLRNPQLIQKKTFSQLNHNGDFSSNNYISKNFDRS